MPVYFAQADGPAGPVKIGYSAVPMGVTKRLIGLQSMTFHPLSLLRVIDDGCVVIEEWLHRRYLAHCIRGEWFCFVPEMLTVNPPARRHAVVRMRGLLAGVGAARLAKHMGLASSVLHRWSADGGAPPERVPALVSAAAAFGFDVDAAVLTVPSPAHPPDREAA